MKSSSQRKTAIPQIFITLALACIGLLPEAEAVVPPPDGGYPNFTTAEGTNALKNLTTGAANTAVGWFSLFSNTGGSFNTGVGAGTLLFNNAGEENTATGVAALLSNIGGIQNTANGTLALFSNTEGDQNTAMGDAALQNNTVGGANTATGFQTLGSNIDGNLNTAHGDRALFSQTHGDGNTAVGFQALVANTTGSDNIALGRSAGIGVGTASNVIAIGHAGADVSNTTWIGHVFGVTTVSGTTLPVIVSDNGQLGTMSSSRRFKKEIKPMDKASEAILALKPVTFHYKSDKTNRPEFGLIAEEVAEINPDLVVRNKNGEIYTVRYEAVSAMLLNEFLKEHKTVQELESTVLGQQSIIAQQQESFQRRFAEQEKQIRALTSAVERVNAQLEMNNSAPRVAADER
jgi:Chaperone of endosialidase